jgi:uncharacterized protein (TIGR03437 family)
VGRPSRRCAERQRRGCGDVGRRCLRARNRAGRLGPYSPGIFAINSGVGTAIAINPDGSLAAASGSIPGIAAHPAKAGDPNGLIILATGLGAMDSYPANGDNSHDKVRRNLNAPEVLVGGMGAPVAFSGASPQFVGVNQINFTIPDGAPTGDRVPLQLRSGGITTTDRVTIAVIGALWNSWEFLIRLNELDAGQVRSRRLRDVIALRFASVDFP